MSTIHYLPSSSIDRVLVVGAGVSGLTSALCLARAGVDVEVVAEKFQTARELHKMNELAPKVRGFVHDPGLADANGIDPAYGIVDAYAHLAPMIDTDRYMGWLRRQVEAAGVTITQRRIEGQLSEQEAQLRAAFRADAIVNCTGLGAAQTHGAPMYPLRGALVRAINDGSRMPKIDEAHCVPYPEGSTEQDMVFIVPRGENMLLMGGLTEEDEWSLDIGLHNHQPVRDVYRRCLDFMPVLTQAALDPTEPVRVGLRPVRNGNVCLEREADTSIVHNYGHGGSGFSFSWGCAHEVTTMLARELALPGALAA